MDNEEPLEASQEKKPAGILAAKPASHRKLDKGKLTKALQWRSSDTQLVGEMQLKTKPNHVMLPKNC